MKGDHASPFSLHGSCSLKSIFSHHRKKMLFCLVASFGILRSDTATIKNEGRACLSQEEEEKNESACKR